MASLKAQKPVGNNTQLPAAAGQVKKEPAAAPQAGCTESKSPCCAKQQPAKKAELKPREPKKKAIGGKAGSKN